MRTIIVIVFYILVIYQTAFTQSDSTTLTYNAYMQYVIKHHPVSKQADLQLNRATIERLAARGGFDPKISSDWNDKFFDDKQYFRIFRAGVKVPTDYGLTVTGGYENTEGVFLNPENKTDPRGLWSLGIEANVLQGLLMDERRAALQQAEVIQKMTVNERQLMLNELLVKASMEYFYWQQLSKTQTVILESVALAETYFENTRQSFINGDKPAIDTLEAYLVVQDRQLFLQKNTQLLVKSQQQLENYLWLDNAPIALQTGVRPEPLTTFVPITTPNLTETVAAHPMLLEKEYKIDSYTIERKLKREKLKPKLKLKYNPLLATTANSAVPTYSLNDYKWGFDFSMPLFRRKARADLQKTDLKIQTTELDIENKRNELKNKLEANLQQQRLLLEQEVVQQQNLANYARLLEAEQEKFSFGESSVFLLNKRQEKYIDVQIKLIDLQTKIEQTTIEYHYLTGQFEAFLTRQLK